MFFVQETESVMIRAHEHHAEKDFSSDLEALHDSFANLRDDVAKLVDNAVGAAKDGAGALKDRGADSYEQVGRKIGENPMLSTAIAFGVGFILAKMLSRR